jgi:peroxiredoxin
MVAIGTVAPDFSLEGTDGTEEGRRRYSLSEFRGRPVVLVFYPGDNTPVCTRQLNTYTAEVDEFRAVDAQVLAISPFKVTNVAVLEAGAVATAQPTDLRPLAVALRQLTEPAQTG